MRWRVAAARFLLCALPATTMAAPRATQCQDIPVVGMEGDTSFANVQTRAPIPLREAQPVARYEIGARLDPATRTVRGKLRLHWRNRSAATVCALYLHQDFNAFENRGTAYMARLRERGVEPRVARGEWGYAQISGVRQEGLAASWTYAATGDSGLTDRSVVRIDLPEPVAAGGTATLDMDFLARLPGTWAASGQAGGFHFAGRWFPQVALLQLPGERGAPALRWNAPAFAGDPVERERADFDVHLEVPYGYVAVSSGETRDVARTRNGRRNFHFVQDDATTLAWAADPHFFAQPLEYVYVPGEGEPVKLRVYYGPGDTAVAVRVLGAMSEALAGYGTALGAARVPALTAVVGERSAGRFAVEPVAGLFAVGADPAADTATPEQQVLAAIGAAYLPEGTSGPFRAGVQRYWSERFLPARNDAPETRGWLRRLLAPWRLAFAAVRERWRTRADADATRAAHVARVLRDLEARIGAPAVDRAFRAWRRSARAGYPDTGQVRWLMADASGDAEVFQRAFAIIDAGLPVDDRIVRFTSEELLPQPGYVLRGEARVEMSAADVRRAVRERRRQWMQSTHGSGSPFGYRTEVIVQRDGALLPQTLTVTFADGSTRQLAWDDTRNPVRFAWTTKAPATTAQLDPAQRGQLERNRLDDGRTVHADLQPVADWSGEVATFVQFATAWLVQL